MTVNQELTAAHVAYWDAVTAIARRRLSSDVFPLLRRRRYRMLSGNGTFYLETRAGKQIDTDPREHRRDPDLARVLEILNAEIPGSVNCLGSLGYDYPPSND